MSFELDNFDDDIKIAEEGINENSNDRFSVQETRQGHGNHGLCTDEQPQTKGSNKKNTTRELGLFTGISNADYHAGRGISSSSIKYACKAMELYHAHMTGKVSFKETLAMKLGTAVHKLCLEALDFSSDIAVSKKFGTKAADKEEKAYFYEQNAGKTIITADQYDQCRFMRDSLMSLPEIADIFESGEPELSGYYVDRSESGDSSNMLCKYRPDWRTDWSLFDVKTTKDLSEAKFSRTIHDLGYHISAAHYLEGDRILKGTDHRQFIFGCVEPEPPYLAHMYVLDDQSLQVGEYERRKALSAIKLARQTNEYTRYKNGVSTEIGLPQYAMRDFMRDKI